MRKSRSVFAKEEDGLASDERVPDYSMYAMQLCKDEICRYDGQAALHVGHTAATRWVG